MVYLANIVSALATIIHYALEIYFYIVIISAVISWLNPDPYNPIVRFLRNTTEPIYFYIRRHIPFVNLGGIDLSPIVVLLAIKFVQLALVANLFHLANSMAPARTGMPFTTYPRLR